MGAKTDQTVEIPALPTTIEEFVALRNDLATTPHGGVAVYMVALVLYSNDVDLGLKCLTVAMDASELSDGDAYKGKSPSRMRLRELKDRIGAKPYIARSYFLGTSPENTYELPSGSLSVKIRHQAIDVITDERAKLFVYSTGADSPRPAIVQKNNRGLWKAKGYNSLDVGVRPPVVIVDDDL